MARQEVAPEQIGVEVGSNSNGDYIKYPDGRMVCWTKRLTLTQTSGARCQGTWTFPQAFSATDGLAVQATLTTPTDATVAESFAADAAPNTEMMSSVGTGGITTSSVAMTIDRVSGMTNFASGDKMYVSLVAWGQWS